MTKYSAKEILEATGNLSYAPTVVIELNTLIAKAEVNFNISFQKYSIFRENFKVFTKFN